MSDTSSTPNPSSAILWFFIITSIFFSIKYYIGDDKAEGSSKKNVFMGIYILLIIIGEYFINLSLTNAM